MKTKHIILRTLRASTRDAYLGDHRDFPAAAVLATTTLTSTVGSKIDVDEIDRKDIAKLGREADTVAVAPAMPINWRDTGRTCNSLSGWPHWFGRRGPSASPLC